ncbi:UDP-glucuronosyltransferase-like [Thrips palmi]|uniref:UDP-glucuronosyltransferase-like n=1 Tax=Thrips palmi TaxID=161013 RepID=A0A6P8ZJ53_THRPL|nr:UDP-glucuronosyltransferase-like [Thrips palmi]
MATTPERTLWRWLCLIAVVLCLGAPGATPRGAEAARILVVISMPAPSHLIVFTGLSRALAERGHEITFVTPTEKDNKLLPTKNHVIVSVQDAEVEAYKKKSVIKFLTNKNNFFVDFFGFISWGPQLLRATLKHPAFKAEINKPGQKFDVVITEAFFLQEAMVALGHKFNAPVVALNPFGLSPMVNEIMGNPMNPSWQPNAFLGFTDDMDFKERLLNTLSSTFMRTLYLMYQLPLQQEVVTEFFPDAPPLTDLLYDKLALTLINNHFSLSSPVPMVPGVVEIGGMHIPDKARPLPKDLQTYMDEAKEGVVYFSMGSNLIMEYVPAEKTTAIFNALGALKQRVLMKWDGPAPANASANIRIVKWAPQADILAHPNLRLFVTHGGLLSTQESVYNSVPLVGIPTFADQEFNMKSAFNKGFCEYVSYTDLSEEKLGAAIAKVLASPSYREAAARLSRLFRSKPMRPADLAVFWVEHVIQHGGKHLRSASVRLKLYQVLLLDVLAVVLAPLVLLALLLRALCRCCCGRKAAVVDKEDKKLRSKKNK